MCIIVYKPANTPFPKKKILKACFENNSDGAGFMYAVNDRVYIEKGFMGFSSFNKALKQVRMQYGEDIPYVLHFRISTQAGQRQDCCHPFPLSRKMDDLRLLKADTDIGIAHNGIIDLTSSYYSIKVDYSDTMKFITDFLSLIIKGRNFYKSKDTLTLIERLVESKLAILDGSGRCTLIGEFIEDEGIYYSNTTYKETKYKYSAGAYSNPFRSSAASASYSWTSNPITKAELREVEGDFIDMYNCGYENYGTYAYCESCMDKDSCPQYIYDGKDYYYGRYSG